MTILGLLIKILINLKKNEDCLGYLSKFAKKEKVKIMEIVRVNSSKIKQNGFFFRLVLKVCPQFR